MMHPPDCVCLICQRMREESVQSAIPRWWGVLTSPKFTPYADLVKAAKAVIHARDSYLGDDKLDTIDDEIEALRKALQP